MQAALPENERIRRATDLPPFFGNTSKDVVSARMLIDRFETAAEVATWDNDARKINNFKLLLRDRAILWWKQLAYNGVDIAVWDTVKQNFLKVYEPKYTARTACANFSELAQRQGEGTYDYYLRVTETADKIQEHKPAALANVRAPVPAAGPDAAYYAVVKNEGLADMEKYYRHQFFIAGLKEPFRSKVMEAGKDNLTESVDVAVELETIYQQRQVRAIAAIEEDYDENNCAEFTDEELGAINAIRQRQGAPPLRRRFNGSNGQNGQSPSGPFGGKCRYCKKPGHMQKYCKARIQARAPMVDKDGKPFTKRVAAVESGTDTSTAPSTANAQNAGGAGPSSEPSVGSILSSALNSLNW